MANFARQACALVFCMVAAGLAWVTLEVIFRGGAGLGVAGLGSVELPAVLTVEDDVGTCGR